jgi:hypothetical protein
MAFRLLVGAGTAKIIFGCMTVGHDVCSVVTLRGIIDGYTIRGRVPDRQLRFCCSVMSSVLKRLLQIIPMSSLPLGAALDTVHLRVVARHLDAIVVSAFGMFVDAEFWRKTGQQ